MPAFSLLTKQAAAEYEALVEDKIGKPENFHFLAGMRLRLPETSKNIPLASSIEWGGKKGTSV